MIFLLLACAKSIEPGSGGDDSGSSVADGEATVDATSETEWVYLDLAGGKIVSPATPEDSTEWDLGFRRFRVKVNGGVSGTADMAVVPFYEKDYDTPLEEPTKGWVTDEDDTDADGLPEYALDTWFAYDVETHEVTPADVIYAIRDRASDVLKLQFLDYYDDAGSPAHVHLRWGPLSDEGTTLDDTGDKPVPFTCSTDSSTLTNTDLGGGVTLTQLYTGSTEEWMCWSFATSSLVQKGWDLSMQKWDFRTGATEVALLPKQDFDALKVAPADGYLTDTDDKHVFEDWYIYDTEIHVLYPADVVYVLHTADGAYWKMQITTYYPPSGDKKQPHWPAWKWAAVAPPKK